MSSLFLDKIAQFPLYSFLLASLDLRLGQEIYSPQAFFFLKFLSIELGPDSEVLSQFVERLSLLSVMLPVKRQHVLVLADEVVIDHDLGQIGSHHFLVVIVIAVVQLGDHHTATTMLVNVLKAALGPLHLLHTLALFVLDHYEIFLVLDLCQATVSFTFDHFTVSIVRLLKLFVIFVHQRPHEVFKFDSLVF